MLEKRLNPFLYHSGLRAFICIGVKEKHNRSSFIFAFSNIYPVHSHSFYTFFLPGLLIITVLREQDWVSMYIGITLA